MEVKLMLAYNIKPNREDEYYRYVLGEFLPTVQTVGLHMVEGWHTAYGNYPIRLIVFRTEDEATMREAIKSKEWKTAKEKLLKMVRDYEERIVPAKNMFQFFLPSDR
jgi:glucose-6-phosphate isomerase